MCIRDSFFGLPTTSKEYINDFGAIKNTFIKKKASCLYTIKQKSCFVLYKEIHHQDVKAMISLDMEDNNMGQTTRDNEPETHPIDLP